MGNEQSKYSISSNLVISTLLTGALLISLPNMVTASSASSQDITATSASSQYITATSASSLDIKATSASIPDITTFSTGIPNFPIHTLPEGSLHITQGTATPIQDKLIVTSSFYQGTATPIVVGSTILAGKTAGSTVTATADGSYLNVWNNNKTDGSFGVTSPVFISFLDSEYGNLQQTINLSDIAARQGYKFVTSFSSKSELAVNLSTDGKSLTLMGYGATQGQLDISNSNTPDVIDPTNPTVGIAAPTYRNVAQINTDGSLAVTSTDGYSGNNGRAAILDATTNTYLMVGNAGNSGSGPTNATLATLSGNTGVQ